MKRLFSKKPVFAALWVLLALALTGCGAVLDTSLAADEAFSGQRVITARISNQNLAQYVDGGLDKLLAVAQENLPEQLEVSAAQGESEASLIFTLNFSSIEDYREKVAALLEGSGKEPAVTFDHQNNEFKSGLVLSESFSSADLLEWYMDALEAADVVSSSRSNWYEMGAASFVFAGVSYDSRFSTALSVREQTSNTLDEVRVSTTLRDDGSYDREIRFTASAATVQALAEGGLELGEYLQGLCPAAGSFTQESDDWSHFYTIAFSASTPQEIASMTDAVLQSEGNQFLCDVMAADLPGAVDVVVIESYDASYYLDYADPYGSPVYPLERRLQAYSGAEQTGGDPASHYEQEDSGAQWNILSPAQGQPLSQTYRWRIRFSNVRFQLKAGASRSSAELELELPLEMAAPAREAAAQALEQSAQGIAALASKDTEAATVYTLSFGAQPTQELSDSLNLFLYAMSGEAPAQDEERSAFLDARPPLLTLQTDAMASAAAFTSALEMRLSGDFGSLTGDAVELLCAPPALGSFEPTRQSRADRVQPGAPEAGASAEDTAIPAEPGAFLLGPGNFSLEGVFLYPALWKWALLTLAVLCAAACLLVVVRNRAVLAQFAAQAKQRYAEKKAACRPESAPPAALPEAPAAEGDNAPSQGTARKTHGTEEPSAASEEREEEFL